MARKPLSRNEARTELGVAGRYGRRTTQLRPDEFIPKLRGLQAIRTFREMRDNDPVIGGILLAIEMILRGAEIRFEASDKVSEAEADEAVEFAEGVFDDMEQPFDTFLSEALSFLPFGFSVFEQVYKIRGGPDQASPERRSKFDDGRFGLRKLAPRAQWTILQFNADENGEVIGITQNAAGVRAAFGMIPIEKLVHFKAASVNNDPSGRSILRNAYVSWHYASHIDMIESIAIERELNGIPVGRIPKEYLASNASDSRREFREEMEDILRDVKFNDQGYILLPSEPYQNADGTSTNIRQVDIELISANGTRAIDTHTVISRHRSDMARSVLADFIMLGQGERGSFALSKSKTDLFLAAAEGFGNTIVQTLNRQLMPTLWRLNGMNPEAMPEMQFNKLAPVDLEELGALIRDAAAGGAPMLRDRESENVVREAAGLPEAQDDPEMVATTGPFAAEPEQEPGDDDDDD